MPRSTASQRSCLLWPPWHHHRLILPQWKKTYYWMGCQLAKSRCRHNTWHVKNNRYNTQCVVNIKKDVSLHFSTRFLITNVKVNYCVSGGLFPWEPRKTNSDRAGNFQWLYQRSKSSRMSHKVPGWPRKIHQKMENFLDTHRFFWVWLPSETIKICFNNILYVQ